MIARVRSSFSSVLQLGTAYNSPHYSFMPGYVLLSIRMIRSGTYSLQSDTRQLSVDKFNCLTTETHKITPGTAKWQQIRRRPIGSVRTSGGGIWRKNWSESESRRSAGTRWKCRRKKCVHSPHVGELHKVSTAQCTTLGAIISTITLRRILHPVGGHGTSSQE